MICLVPSELIRIGVVHSGIANGIGLRLVSRAALILKPRTSVSGCAGAFRGNPDVGFCHLGSLVRRTIGISIAREDAIQRDSTRNDGNHKPSRS